MTRKEYVSVPVINPVDGLTLKEAGRPVALYVKTDDVSGEEVERCVGYLANPFSKSAELRLDLPFGFGSSVSFALRTAPPTSG